ncbi:hypothetical protein [Chryseobacterium indoltheticum]|uniref:hypothetical protein n=1 Tax=Chryseobacterium indoltheticum TaxID=254 RepID=UPI003F49760E
MVKKLELPRLSDEESFAVILKNDLVDLQNNLTEDPFGWRVLVDHAARNSLILELNINIKSGIVS